MLAARGERAPLPMTKVRRSRHTATDSSAARSNSVGNKGGRTRLTVFLTAYLVAALATFGMIQLAHDSDWIAAVALVGSLVGGVATNIIQKKLDAMSALWGHIATAIAAGIATVAVLALAVYWYEQNAEIDARRHITASGNIGMGAGQSATFSVEVPSHRNYLTVNFSGTPSAEDGENCINGASLKLVQNYGATRSDDSTVGFGSDHRIEIPSSVTHFTLTVTFIPQSGFNVCAGDVTIASARFHE